MSTERGDEFLLSNPLGFVRTYNPPAFPDPIDLLEEYYDVIRFAAEHPNLGSAAIAARLDVPRSRIRGWVDDDPPVIPDCIQGLHTAEDRGWVEVEQDSTEFRGLNVLVAQVFSGGSINSQSYVPSFAVADVRDTDRVACALIDVGVEYMIDRSDEPGRATEIKPTESATILGRVLASMGAPVGEKVHQPLQLPDYLYLVDERHRRAFVRTYLENRGQQYDTKETITFREERADQYLNELTAFMEDMSGAQVRRNGKNVVVSAEAAREILS